MSVKSSVPGGGEKVCGEMVIHKKGVYVEKITHVTRSDETGGTLERHRNNLPCPPVKDYAEASVGGVT